MKFNKQRFGRLRKYVPWARKAYRRTGRIAKSRRIFRRFINRQALKPELKHVVQSGNQLVGYGGTGVGTNYATSLTPITLAQGVTTATRIGNMIKYVKVDLRMVFYDNSGNTGATAPDWSSFLVRYVIWTPRSSTSDANAYVTNITMNSVLDFDALTVYKDVTFSLAPAFIDVGSTSQVNTGARCQKVINHKIMFPRKVHFSATNTDLDPSKDIMNIVVIPQNNAGIGFYFNFSCKTWYFDA